MYLGTQFRCGTGITIRSNKFHYINRFVRLGVALCRAGKNTVALSAQSAIVNSGALGCHQGQSWTTRRKG